MCKYCEVENRELLCDDNTGYLYIMNNLGIPPQLVYSTGKREKIKYQLISYCPICGARLVNFEDLHIVERSIENEN